MIVLDVNAAITIAKGTEEGRTLRELMMEGEEVVAPHFFLTELGNVVWQIENWMKRTFLGCLSEPPASSIDLFPLRAFS